MFSSWSKALSQDKCVLSATLGLPFWGISVRSTKGQSKCCLWFLISVFEGTLIMICCNSSRWYSSWSRWGTGVCWELQFYRKLIINPYARAFNNDWTNPGFTWRRVAIRGFRETDPCQIFRRTTVFVKKKIHLQKECPAVLVSEGKIYARLLGFLQKIHLQNLICHSITRSVAVHRKKLNLERSFTSVVCRCVLCGWMKSWHRIQPFWTFIWRPWFEVLVLKMYTISQLYFFHFTV